MDPTPQVQYLRTLPAVRAQAYKVYDLVKQGKSQHFALDESKIRDVAEMVVSLARRDYASMDDIPYHSRFRHFEAGGFRRLDEFRERSAALGMDEHEQARSLIDLIFVSVLLDAGAGGAWKYREETSGQYFNRSEGLGVASFRMFLAGLFSDDASKPLRVTSAGLENLLISSLAEGFQVSEENPMSGLEGRCEVVKAMGISLASSPRYFMRDSVVRPGFLYDYLSEIATTDASGKRSVRIPEIWEAVMQGFQLMWPSDRLRIDGHNMGDVWENELLRENLTAETSDLASFYSPFHKLSQWLTYSLLESLERSGFAVTETHLLTGLPEYRNGGLMVDMGVLSPKWGGLFTEPQAPGSQAIIEWRCLTVCLLDKVAEQVRELLGLTVAQLPLAKVLEAGTWKAGRVVAKNLRSDGGPPITIISDGTVF